MPMHAPAHDPIDFAQRLKEALGDAGENTARGAGVALARRYKSSVVTANAWLKGEHMPSPERARLMAADLGVTFDWLYFGNPPKRALREPAAEYDIAEATIALNARERALLAAYRAADAHTRAVIETVLEAARAKGGN